MKTAIATGLLALAVLIFFSDVIFQGRVLLTANPAAYQPWSAYAAPDALRAKTYRTDSIFTYLPRQAELRRGIAEGRLPLWNPYIAAGAPFFADPQSRALYPVSLALTMFAAERAAGYDVALHFFLAALGMFLFLRAIWASHAGATLGAFAYAFSSFFFTRMGHPTFVASAAWIPFFFYGFERARSGSRGGALPLAAFLVMGYLAGFPQVFLFGVAALVIYACWLAIDAAPRRRRDVASRGIGVARILGVAGLVSILVVSIHLVPFIETLRNSVGLGIPYGKMAGSLLSKPVLLLRSVFPDLFGNPAQGTSWLPLVQEMVHPYNVGLMIYVGVGALLAALGGIAFIRTSGHIRAMLALLAVSVGLGTSGLMLRMAYAVLPLVGYSQIDRVSVIGCFALAALAGLGFSMVSRSNDARAARVSLGIVVLAVAIILAGSFAFLLRGDGILSVVPSAFRAGEAGTAQGAARQSADQEEAARPGAVLPGTPLPGEGAGNLAERIARDPAKWVTHERRQVVRGLVISLASLGLLAACGLLRRRPRLAAVSSIVFVAWAVVEVGSVARGYYVSQRAPAMMETEGIGMLKRGAGDPPVWRVAGEDLLRPVLPPNTNQLFGLQSLGGRATLMPRSYALMAGAGRALDQRAAGRALDPREGRDLDPRAGQVAESVAPASDLAGFMGVRYVLSPGYDARLAVSPILEAVAQSGGSVRILRLGDEARVAFCQPMGREATVGLMIPGAQRLDFLVGLADAAGGSDSVVGSAVGSAVDSVVDSVVVLAECRVGAETVRTAERLDAAALRGRWRRCSLLTAPLGAGYGSLTLSVKPVGLGEGLPAGSPAGSHAGLRAGSAADSRADLPAGPGVRPDETTAAWSAPEFVFGDCATRPMEGGFSIELPQRSLEGLGTKSAGEALSLEVASSAREATFEVVAGARRTVRRMLFGAGLTARTLLVDIGGASSGEVTVTADSAFSINRAATAYYPRPSERRYDVVYCGDMYVFENTAAVARAVCVDRASIGSGDPAGRYDLAGRYGLAGSEALLVSSVLGRIPYIECGRAQVTTYRPERVEIEVSADRDCYLLIQDTHYPGWKAYVDGAETDVVITDVGTRAVEVARGEHTIVMKFIPSNFWTGLALSCAGLVLGTAYAARRRFSARG